MTGQKFYSSFFSFICSCFRSLIRAVSAYRVRVLKKKTSYVGPVEE